MTPKTQAIRDQLAKLDALREKQSTEYANLRRSLAIAELVPGAFDHGSVRIRWVARMAPHPSREQVLRGTLIAGNGTEHRLPENAAEVLGVTPDNLTREVQA